MSTVEPELASEAAEATADAEASVATLTPHFVSASENAWDGAEAAAMASRAMSEALRMKRTMKIRQSKLANEYAWRPARCST